MRNPPVAPRHGETNHVTCDGVVAGTIRRPTRIGVHLAKRISERVLPKEITKNFPGVLIARLPPTPGGTHQPATIPRHEMRSFLLLASLVGGASALRHEPHGALSLGSRLATQSSVSDSASRFTAIPVFPVMEATATMLLTEKCSAAYDILNKDQGYLDAIGKVFDDAKVVGDDAAEACSRHLKPSANPVGGWCKQDAQEFWTEDQLADIPVLERACEKALSADEVAPVVWLNQFLVTRSPLSYAPFLGIELQLPNLLPIYVPKSCRNDADEGMILAFFSDACAREEKKQLKECKYSLA
jgi:hypothetical protein